MPKKLTLQAGVSLAVARKLTADAMHAVAQGHDPAETKKETKSKAAAKGKPEASKSAPSTNRGANLGPRSRR
jgi:hypothetical protein